MALYTYIFAASQQGRKSHFCIIWCGVHIQSYLLLDILLTWIQFSFISIHYYRICSLCLAEFARIKIEIKSSLVIFWNHSVQTIYAFYILYYAMNRHNFQWGCIPFDDLRSSKMNNVSALLALANARDTRERAQCATLKPIYFLLYMCIGTSRIIVCGIRTTYRFGGLVMLLLLSARLCHCNIVRSQMVFIVFADTKLNGCVASVKSFLFVGGNCEYTQLWAIFFYIFILKWWWLWCQWNTISINIE